MKSRLTQNLSLVSFYVVAIILWYWLFRDTPAIRFIAGLVFVGYSLLQLIRPQWFPNLPGLTGRVFPAKIFKQGRIVASWIGILFGAVILSGYRITTMRSMGIFALLFIIGYLPIYLLWIKNSNKYEREKNRKFWILAISSMLIFCALGIWFITLGDKEIKMFSEMSPYPMMIVYALMGVWQYRVIRKKERADALMH